MTFRMKAVDRKERESASAGSGTTIIRLPTDREKLHLFEVQVGPPGNNPTFLKKGEPRM